MKKLFKNIGYYYHDLDKPLLYISILLFTFGLFNIVTASSSEAVIRYEKTLFYYFFRQLVMIVVGVVLSVIIVRRDTKKYLLPFFTFFVIITACVMYLFLYGTFHKGAQNWLTIGSITFQPSEFVKPIMIVCLALIFDKTKNKLRSKKYKHYEIIGLILFVGLFNSVIIFLEKDLGTMLILVIIFMVMFCSSPILKNEKTKTIIFLIIVGLCGLLLIKNQKGYILSEEQMTRFNFINPCKNYLEGGYQICNAFIAINNGGLFGLGIGKSQQKYSYIPEPHTDMVFAIIVEEQGVIRSSLVLIAYTFILYRILDLSSKANTLRGKYICLGVATYIFAHIMINLGGLFGILPLTGVPLPFLSYGGSFTISLLVSLGLVQRVHIEYKRKKIKV
ncbi:MAG: FtsW/RodA/SpoVE family cell cycle protein [Bacilli bacterium]|nr:FtsW/RodA/SpoVE family cell cycle protein [Bacilli bacterium]